MIVLYHGTTAHLAPAIERAGLLPRDGLGPFLTSDPERARGYAVRASCLALADADPNCTLANLPTALLVVATVPTAALLPDPAHAGDYWLTDPSAAKVRCEPFDARPHITSASEARKYARWMQKARAIEDQHGKARRRAAEELRPEEKEATPTGTTPASRRGERPHYGLAPEVARVNAAPPDTGTPLG